MPDPYKFGVYAPDARAARAPIGLPDRIPGLLLTASNGYYSRSGENLRDTTDYACRLFLDCMSFTTARTNAMGNCQHRSLAS